MTKSQTIGCLLLVFAFFGGGFLGFVISDTRTVVAQSQTEEAQLKYEAQVYWDSAYYGADNMIRLGEPILKLYPYYFPLVKNAGWLSTIDGRLHLVPFGSAVIEYDTATLGELYDRGKGPRLKMETLMPPPRKVNEKKPVTMNVDTSALYSYFRQDSTVEIYMDKYKRTLRGDTATFWYKLDTAGNRFIITPKPRLQATQLEAVDAGN